MAFPAIESFRPAADDVNGGAAVNGATAASSHVVNLPATVSAGSLLFIAGRCAGAGAIAITGGGWTIVQDSSDASDDVSFWGYRDTLAAGTEGGTSITVTHGATLKFVAETASITGAENPATRAPQSSTVAVAVSQNVDPTACTPTGGAKDYLWLWVGMWDGEQPTSKTPATNYTDRSDATSGTAGAATTNVQMKIGDRQLNAASEDPGAVATGIATPTGWTAWCIAIHPPAAGGAAEDPYPYVGAGYYPTQG